MTPSLAELLEALPVEADEQARPQNVLEDWTAGLSHRPVPVSRWRRLWVLGTLQARIAAAYVAWWLRSTYVSRDQRERMLNETRLRAALRVLGGMCYLRGAIMKLGQVLAHYPDVAPREFSEVLGRLFFEAPPMHFSLLREFVRGELGADPEEVFDEFETTAFAAASLGQVHRARLKGSGQLVAVKVQYPNIGRTIREDFRNLMALISPMRLNEDWVNFREQMEDVRRMLERETNYEQEAEYQQTARRAFAEEDGVVVPRVFPEFSTRRVLTTEYLSGLHLDSFLATDPPQEVRDLFGERIARATFRLSYGSRLMYADAHPGNYLFLPDGRLGLIDYGCCHPYSDDDCAYLSEMEVGVYTSRQALRRAVLRAVDLPAERGSDRERMDLVERWSDWAWEPILHEGPFDFGDLDYHRRGMRLLGEMIRRRYVRSRPVNTWLTRNLYGIRAMLYHLKARFDYGAVVRAETTVKRPGGNG